MKIFELEIPSFSSVPLPSNNLCLTKAKELAAKESQTADIEINAPAIANAVLENSKVRLLPKDRRALPYLSLDSRFDQFNPSFCSKILADHSKSRGFWSSLFRAWMFHYDPDSQTGQLVRRALTENHSKLTDKCKDIGVKFQVLEKKPNRKNVAKQVLDKVISKDDLRDINFSVDGVSGGKLSKAILISIAQLCKTSNLEKHQMSVLMDLLCPQKVIHDSIKDVALVSLIFGIEHHPKDSSTYLEAKEIVEANYQDPRLYEASWPIIPDVLGGNSAREKCIDTVKQWHIFQSITLFFKLIGEVVEDGDHDHQFPQRRSFWIDYFNKGLVSEAWVILGTKGTAAANRYKKAGDADFEKLSWANLTGAKNDQAVLLMKIGNITVVEWSHSGACRVWKKGDSRAPNFSRRRYDGSELRAEVDNHSKDRIVHDSAGRWRYKITQRINDYSGFRRFL